MMQRASLLCSSNSLSPSPTALPSPHGLSVPFRNRLARTLAASSFVHLPLNLLQNYRHSISPIRCTATEEIVETCKKESGFIEIGYLANVHGLQGEICVKPSTDFPELRFCKPGRRWVKQQVLGREEVQEVELVEGRGHHGQKGWILRFGGIDTVEKAKHLVGSTLLAREEDRPELEEGEFYTRDLVGMRVILKETGEPVGTVVNVFNSGANDLLDVQLDSSIDMPDGAGVLKSVGTGVSGPLVWVPFVEAIVPDVDMNRREMRITPPKGLLELNLRSDERSKKERRQLEWKERKKFQKRLIAAKKKLCEMEQQHVFHGFRYGEKAHGSLLANQIVGVNSKLLQVALQTIDVSSKSWDVTELISATKSKLIRSTLKVSEDNLTSCTIEDRLGSNFKLQEKGLHLMSEGKVASVLVLNDTKQQGSGCDPDLVDSESTENSQFSILQTLLSDDQRFVKMEDRESVPLILICQEHEVQSLKRFFSNNDHFAFDSKKVWFLEEEKLPVLSSSLQEQSRQKILMKSPWEILQTPIGSGGVISLLSSNNIPENLSAMGVEYIEVCSTNQRYLGSNSLLLGYAYSRGADIAIQVSKNTEDIEESYNMIFSMNFMKKLTKQIDKLQFCAIPKTHSHVEKVDKEWVDVTPSSPNAYELSCTIYSSLNACSFDKVCVLEITE